MPCRVVHCFVLYVIEESRDPQLDVAGIKLGLRVPPSYDRHPASP